MFFYTWWANSATHLCPGPVVPGTLTPRILQSSPLNNVQLCSSDLMASATLLSVFLSTFLVLLSTQISSFFLQIGEGQKERQRGREKEAGGLRFGCKGEYGEGRMWFGLAVDSQKFSSIADSFSLDIQWILTLEQRFLTFCNWDNQLFCAIKIWSFFFWNTWRLLTPPLFT
jgi:hypothetical protein